MKVPLPTMELHFTMLHLEHFIMKCSKLEEFRRRDLIGEGRGRETLGKILFDKKRIGEVKTMLGKMWRERMYWLRIREIRRIRENRGYINNPSRPIIDLSLTG